MIERAIGGRSRKSQKYFLKILKYRLIIFSISNIIDDEIC